MFQIILEERKRREIDPTLVLLRACVAEQEASGLPEPHTKARLREMLGFFESMSSLYDEFRRLPLGALRHFVRLKGRIGKLLGV